MPSASRDLTDEEIIKLFNAGETELYPTLIKRHHGKAYQIAYGILYSHHDAEEVVQDSFIKIYKALEKFRGDAKFSTWMYRIVSNYAKNRYRWNKRRGSHVNISMDLAVEGKDNGEYQKDWAIDYYEPSQEITFNELEKGIAEVLMEIPEIYREVLVLRNIEHMSYEDITQVLDCKMGTVKSRIARGRDELKAQLKKRNLL